MKLKQLQSALEDVRAFEAPSVELEQYKTSAHLAARMLFTIQEDYGDIEGKVVADLGCGTGVLAIGSQVLGAGYTIAFDIDTPALSIALENAVEYELEDCIDFVQCDLLAGLPVRRGLPAVDTVVMNPPFGTRTKSADMAFLKAAYDLASGAVYSLHKTSTREHIVKTVASWGGRCEVLAEMKFDVPHMHKFHRKKSVDIEVDFIRVVKVEACGGGGAGAAGPATAPL